MAQRGSHVDVRTQRSQGWRSEGAIEMADWVTISSLATAGGTMVLALATFASVRSANRAARVAERSFQIGLRPVLVPARPEDPVQKVSWIEGQVHHLRGGAALFREEEGRVYIALSLR